MNAIQLLSSEPWVEPLGRALVQFLWQGTLIAGLYSIARIWPGRSCTPRFRYLLACAALIAMVATPTGTFVLSGSTEPAHPALGMVGSLASSAAGTREAWFTPMTVAAARTWRDCPTAYIVLAWFIGAAVCCVRLAGGWLVASRLRSVLVRPAPPEWQDVLNGLCRRVGRSRPVKLLVSAAVQAPTVVGCLRPLILAPVGALTGLSPNLIEALLAHELAHIRRRDYLVNILQGLAEAVLFYHPAVWWVSNEIRSERELCCDDIAVSLCGDTLTYARALAELEGQRPAHRNPALAANGGSLSARVARLLGVFHPPSHVTTQGSGPLAMAILIAVALALATRSTAQPQLVAASSLPAFEVASIKPSDPDSQLKVDFAAGGRLLVTHATLRFLIKIAYDVSDDQVLGGPAWIGSRRFDVHGKPAVAVGGDPQNMTKDQILLFHEPTRLRLQRLLADRFQLELRKESKPMPIFALVGGKNGPKLKRSPIAGDPELTFAHGILQAKRVDMATLARFLSEGQTGRPVIDMTGFTDKFDFRLEWAPDPGLNPQLAGSAVGQQPGADGGISIFTALQQQLGLRLEPRTSPGDCIAVTRAELPSDN